MGKFWHPEHFVCCECKTVISGDSCCEINGAPICDQDFARLSRPKCALCCQPVVGKCSDGDTFKLVDGEPICNICPPFRKYNS